ncbi:MAG: DUF2585 family protein, partial [Pseudomonadota bacterium]
MAAGLIALGRNLICQCGYVKLWHGEVISSENSQHILDWYSPSHVLHGLLFYMALHFLLPRLNIGWRLVVMAVKRPHLWKNDIAPMEPKQVEDLATWVIL